MNAHDMFVEYVNFKCDIYDVPPVEKDLFLKLVENYHNEELYETVLHSDVVDYYIQTHSIHEKNH